MDPAPLDQEQLGTKARHDGHRQAEKRGDPERLLARAERSPPGKDQIIN